MIHVSMHGSQIHIAMEIIKSKKTYSLQFRFQIGFLSKYSDGITLKLMLKVGYFITGTYTRQTSCSKIGSSFAI